MEPPTVLPKSLLGRCFHVSVAWTVLPSQTSEPMSLVTPSQVPAELPSLAIAAGLPVMDGESSFQSSDQEPSCPLGPSLSQPSSNLLAILSSSSRYFWNTALPGPSPTFRQSL